MGGGTLRRPRAWFPTPLRVLSGLLALCGVALTVINRSFPDESRVIGGLLVALGGFLLVTRETRAKLQLLEIVWVTILVFAGGELVVRHENALSQRHYAERQVHFVDDPELRYELKPKTSCGDGVTNSLGMIDVERAEPKPPGTLRVACLGDSVGGDCSLPKDNACAALERELTRARAGKETEVLNFSVPGYNTIQQARSLELKATRFAPDAIVLLFVVNDPYPDLAISHMLPGHLKFEHLLYSGGRMLVARLLGTHADPFVQLRQLYESPPAWDGVVVNGFHRIGQAARARNAPVVVAVFPLFVETGMGRYADVYDKVVREGERHGFIAIDLSKTAFANESLPALLKESRDAIHPNAHAHALVARVIADELLRANPELRSR